MTLSHQAYVLHAALENEDNGCRDAVQDATNEAIHHLFGCHAVDKPLHNDAQAELQAAVYQYVRACRTEDAPQPSHVRNEDPPVYAMSALAAANARNDETIALALAVLAGRLRKPGATMEGPQAVKDFLVLKLAALEHEVFSVLYLDSQHGVIDYVEHFHGTLAQTSVYPREIAKRALALNAAAVVLAHNHPSQHAEPSRADEALTKVLTDALRLVDVRVLDHIVVGGMETTSFAERGLL